MLQQQATVATSAVTAGLTQRTTLRGQVTYPIASLHVGVHDGSGAVGAIQRGIAAIPVQHTLIMPTSVFAFSA